MSDHNLAQVESSDDWLSTIVSKSEVTLELTTSILAKWRIHPSPTIQSPRRLLLKRIEFSGTKRGVLNEGPFAFTWDELGCGLWGMTTERNLRGKSSVLEIVQWLIRGRRSNNLQEDVYSWVTHASLSFSLDDVEHCVEVDRHPSFGGRLCRHEDGLIRTIANFNSEIEFENTMADFFMHKFELETVTNWVSSSSPDHAGRAVVHSWPALAGVMFIGTDYASLLGDLPAQSGVPIRLLQMYLGLPWIPTLSSAKTALKAVQNDIDLKANRLSRANASKQARIAALDTAIQQKQSALEAIPSDKALNTSFAEKSSELLNLRNRELELDEIVRRATGDVRLAEVMHSEDRHDLQSFLDADAATSVFKAIDPSCCPRCEAVIDKDRKTREDKDHKCSICDSPIISDSDGADRQCELEERVLASKNALAKAKTILANTNSELEQLRRASVSTEEDVKRLAVALSDFAARNRLQIDIATLEGRRLEVESDSELEGTPGADELRVLSATVEETESRMKIFQTRILATVSSTIKLFAQRFGMSNLTSVNLKGNLTLSLEKGGSTTSYSKVTPGEKLRLKVATVLAMIHVGEKEGVGRHPGLLMLDSPGAEELAPEDLEQLITGLESLSKDFKHLQVFVAAVANQAVLNHIPQLRLRSAKGEDSLW